MALAPLGLLFDITLPPRGIHVYPTGVLFERGRTRAMDHEHQHTATAAPADLTRTAVSATLHCLTGCAIGEILGMVIGTALGWANWPTVALAVALAFLFGYSLTIGPVLRAGVAFR